MTLYLRRYSGTAPHHVTLEEGADASVVASKCRDAALEFVRGVRLGWGSRDLAEWLTGLYGRATGYVPRGECVPFVDDDSAPRAHLDDGPRVDSVLWTARGAVLVALEDAQAPDTRLVFVRNAIRRGDVVPAVDVGGTPLWIPLDRRKMHLRDRVLSLFAVDFLLRPEDYVGDLLVCRMCEQVVFDPAARMLGHCGAHRSSGFVTRMDDAPDRDEAAEG